MTAVDRLRTEIKLISPEYQEFIAQWAGSSRKRDKKTGIFEYPKFDGSIVQDLDFNSARYPMTIYFDGADHDTDARRFWDALAERGKWEVTHPVHGVLYLQPLSVEEVDDPIESGNVTAFTLDWIEPASDSAVMSKGEEKASLLARVKSTLQKAQSTFQRVRCATFNAISTIISTVQFIGNLTDYILGPFISFYADLKTGFDQIGRAIDRLTSDDALDATGPMNSMILAPSRSGGDYTQAMDAYGRLTDEVIALSPEGTSDADFNRAMVIESALVAILASACQIAVTSTYTSRSQVVAAMDNLGALYARVLAALDSIMTQFAAEPLDKQYFSALEIYPDISEMVSSALRYLLAYSFDLKIEKRITLDRPRSPVEITLTEYGSMDYYDQFIATNKLKNNDILIIPAGREVVVYV